MGRQNEPVTAVSHGPDARKRHRVYSDSISKAFLW